MKKRRFVFGGLAFVAMLVMLLVGCTPPSSAPAPTVPVITPAQVHDEVTTLSARVKTVEDNMKNLPSSSDLTALKASVDSLKASISDLTTKVSDLTTKLTQLQAQLAADEAKIAALTAKPGSTTTPANAVTTSITAYAPLQLTENPVPTTGTPPYPTTSPTTTLFFTVKVTNNLTKDIENVQLEVMLFSGTVPSGMLVNTGGTSLISGAIPWGLVTGTSASQIVFISGWAGASGWGTTTNLTISAGQSQTMMMALTVKFDGVPQAGNTISWGVNAQCASYDIVKS